MNRYGRGSRQVVLGVVVLVTLTLTAGPTAAAPYESQVRGGVTDGAEFFPEVAVVLTVDGACSGTLVAPQWVLTAGHCLHDVPATEVLVGLDGTTLDNVNETYASRVHTAHVNFNPSTLAYDFGLIRLPRPSSQIPALRATGAQLPLTAPGTPGGIVGWGGVDNVGSDFGTLRLGSVDVASDSFCSDLYPGYDPNVMLCGDATDADGCLGDSGGPFYVLDDQNEVLWLMGMTSFGDDCVLSANGGAGVYSWLPAGNAWINGRLDADRVTRVQSRMRYRFSKTSIRLGRRLTIAGWLFRDGDRTPLQDQRVQLLRRPAGTKKAFKVVGAKVTGAKGKVSFRQSPKRDMVYRLRHRRTPVTTKRRTDSVTVVVRS